MQNIYEKLTLYISTELAIEHVAGSEKCQSTGKKKETASSVNRTRASSMATTNSTTRPMMLFLVVRAPLDYMKLGVVYSPLGLAHSSKLGQSRWNTLLIATVLV
jgi:hypothetical protein